jgi:GTP-binding protein HflX
VLEDGRPGQWYAAHVVPDNPAGDLWSVRPPLPAHEALREDFAQFLRELEAQLARERRLRVVNEENRALLVQVHSPRRNNPSQADDPDVSLAELRELSATAGLHIADIIRQQRNRPDPRTVLGRGKLQDLTLRSMQLNVELVVFDCDLTPTQVRSIAEACDLRVIDRTQLILDIFAQRARTKEGKQQVELAQLRYRLPRLSRNHSAFSRLAGGIGGRGPGEQKLEVDRRRVKDRITLLQKQLRQVSKSRGVRRQQRNRRQIPVISIVGYTNAGKSTLLNTLTQSKVLAENKLFATLDPTSRRLRFPREREVVITDTVGFIRALPPDLIRAFQATLEELQDADLLLHVVDVSSPVAERHLQAVDEVLRDLKLDDRPILRVLNKVDQLPSREEADNLAIQLDGVLVSALDSGSLEPLLLRIQNLLWQERGEQVDLGGFSSSQ